MEKPGCDRVILSDGTQVLHKQSGGDMVEQRRRRYGGHGESNTRGSCHAEVAIPDPPFRSLAMAVTIPEKTPIVAERPLGLSAGDTTPLSPSSDGLDDADKKLEAMGYTPVRTQI